MELLAPAGSIDQALQAINNGADAVYFGLKDFSARKAAGNFDRSQARALKKRCLEKQVKMYCTLNTIITEPEIPELIKTLKFLDYLECDGIIVQDFAIPELCSRLNIKIPLHASTQMAVHSPDGAAFLKKCGFTRVIPARELTTAEINAIHSEVPDLELEVFIHGALCYGISGNCFASSFITGRSGNRGECSQICRTWFESSSGRGFFFSAADLARQEDIFKLKDAGVSSLKIEGRMKSPAYAGAAAAYYRSILDNRKADKQLEKALKTAFSRKWWPGFSLQEPFGCVDPQYPGHRGLKAGRVMSWEDGYAEVKLAETMHSRDGILFLGRENGLTKPVRLAWPALHVNNKKEYSINAGETVTIPVSEQVSGDFYKISAHDDQPAKKTVFSGADFWKKPVSFKATIQDDRLEISCKGKISASYGINADKSADSSAFTRKFSELMKKSGESLYSCAELDIQYENSRGSSIFIRPSLLKSIKKDIFSRLDALLEEEISLPPRILPGNTMQNTPRLPERRQLNPQRELPLPFLSSFDEKDGEIPARAGEFTILPLRPVNFDEIPYKEALFSRVSRHKAGGDKLLIGLNNPAHLKWAAELAGENVCFFIDYALCCANSAGLAFLQEKIPGIQAFVPWIEAREELSFGNIQKIDSKNDFSVPLFTSRHCYFAARYGCADCKNRTNSEELVQNGKKHLVTAENCITYLIRNRSCR